MRFQKDRQYYKFSLYGFFKNLRFFEPFYILFLLGRGLSYVEIGSLYTLREILRNIFEIPAGAFADAVGRRRSMLMAFVLYILSFLVYYISKSYWGFATAVVLFAFADAFRSGTHKAMILQYLKMKGWEDQKISYYGHTRSWSQAGSAFSALIAALIIFITGNYDLIFLFSIIPYLIDLILLYSYPPAFDEGKTNFKLSALKKKFKAVGKDFIVSFKRMELLRAMLNLSVYTGYYKAIRDYLQPLIKSLAITAPVAFLAGYDTGKKTAAIIGITYFVLYMLTSRASLYSGKIASRFRTVGIPLNISILAGLGAGIISGFLYLSGFKLAAIFVYMIIMIVENIRKPMGISHVSDKLEKDIMATALSAAGQTETIVAALLAPLIGFFADLWGPGTAIIIVSGLMLLLSPLYLAGKNKKSPNKPG